jgi:hypothetical protein
MLIGNKFLFLKIPRTGTTSFENSCFLANIEVKYPTERLLSHKIAATGNAPKRHSHEPVSIIREVFGNDYPIVAVKRDDLDRFISAWKYSIKELEKTDPQAASILSEVSNTLFIKTWVETIGYSSLLSELEALEEFLTRLVGRPVPPVKHNLNYYFILATTISGPSRWHENDPNIIYFNFTNLTELEKYVKETVNPSFEFIMSNHSRNQRSNLKPTDELREFYYKWVDPSYKVISTLL